MDYVGEHRVDTLSVSVFPAAQPTSFDYYEDDGRTYAYQHGAFFAQHITVQASGERVNLETAPPSGAYRPEPRYYIFAVHRMLAQAVSLDDQPLPGVPSLTALRRCSTACWAIGGDRFGGVTYLKVPFGAAHKLRAR
jgi:hypothetical protein